MTEYERTGTDFTAKVAIVTGGGSGIGRATAILLARRGAKVVVGDVNDAAAAEVVAVIERAGGVAVYQPTDVRRDTACEALVACAVDRFGQLDIAFNNAGIIDNPPARTADMDPSAWQRVIDVNLTGIFNCMRHELKVMEQRGGCIVNTSSTSGIRGIRGGAAYCASKHGVIGLTRAAALEYGRFGIRVNAVCPGFVGTRWFSDHFGAETYARIVELYKAAVPLDRVATAEDVAEVVTFFCSEGARHITGETMLIDGGHHLAIAGVVRR